MNGLSFERLFTMSAFEAARTIRLYKRKRPDDSPEDRLSMIYSLEPDAAANDFKHGAIVESLVNPSLDGIDYKHFYRGCIDATISQNGVWTKMILRGRQAFVNKLESDQAQCFRSAGLMDSTLTDELVSWWDQTAGAARLEIDQARLEQGRKGEMMSLAHERERLIAMGIDKEPVWMAIEDNNAGYDVLSYDLGDEAPINRLIEVKSTIASPMRFFLTRTEWETALQCGDRYFFHIWDLNTEQLHEKTVCDIAPSIPVDHEGVKWKQLEITLDAMSNAPN